MIKKILFPVALLLITLHTFAQKPQKVGYLDMEYILENVPEYTAAQSKLDTKINKWNDQLTKKKNEIDKLISDLNNEKALLTADLIREREEDINIKNHFRFFILKQYII